jgi:endoglucanase
MRLGLLTLPLLVVLLLCARSVRADDPAPAVVAPSADMALWLDYANRFIQADGRVVDTGLGGISHSEAQGTAMLFAERHDDRARFDRIWIWTHVNLGVRKDSLFAWSWHPEGREHVTDKNNATDGDLLIAWALAEAGARWQVQAYRDAAGAITKTLLAKLMRDTDAGPVLLPGTEGFESPKGIVVNLSYAILPAYRMLDTVIPNPLWHRLSDTTHTLIGAARFGRFSLPPDWLFVPKGWKAAGKGPTLTTWPEKPPRFGFDAIRVPLYLAWTGSDGRDLWPYQSFWSYFDPLPFHPAWIDLAENAVPIGDMPAGFARIRKLADEASHPTGAAPPFNPLAEKEDYFSASLSLLSDLAWHDRGMK